MKRLASAGSAAILIVVILGLIFVVVRINAASLDGIKCVVHPGADALAETSHEYKGGKIYFCCFGCPNAFERAPSKYFTSANRQLIATRQARQHKCPLTGGDLKEGTEMVVGGVQVRFCCDKCKRQVESLPPDKQLQIVFGEDAFEKAGFKVGW